MKTLLGKNDKIYCVVDLKLKKHFKDLSKNNHFKFIFLKSGKNKSLEKFKFVSEKLLSQNIDRQSTLVSIGGGTLGDLCGFI